MNDGVGGAPAALEPAPGQPPPALQDGGVARRRRAAERIVLPAALPVPTERGSRSRQPSASAGRRIRTALFAAFVARGRNRLMPAAPPLANATLSQRAEPLRLRYHDSPVPGWLRMVGARCCRLLPARMRRQLGCDRAPPAAAGATATNCSCARWSTTQTSLIGIGAARRRAPARGPARRACDAGAARRAALAAAATPAGAAPRAGGAGGARAAAARNDRRTRSTGRRRSRSTRSASSRACSRATPARASCGSNWWCCRARACSPQLERARPARRRARRHRRGRRRRRRARRQPAAARRRASQRRSRPRCCNLALGRGRVLRCCSPRCGIMLGNRERRTRRWSGRVAAAQAEAREARKLRSALETLRCAPPISSRTQRAAQPTVLEVLADLTRRLPDDTWLEKLAINGGKRRADRPERARPGAGRRCCRTRR